MHILKKPFCFLLSLLIIATLFPIHNIHGEEVGGNQINLAFASGIANKDVNVTIDYSDTMLTNASTSYNHDLAVVSSVLSASAYGSNNGVDIIKNNYKALGVKEEDMEFHYDLNYKTDGKDQVAYSFGIKHTNVNGEDVPIAFIFIRGSYANAEWVSNLNINDKHRGWSWDEMHEGFNKANKIIMANFTKFLNAKHASQEKTKVLITGHSRGAGVANLLGGDIDAHVDGLKFVKENVHVYTFASPNTTTKSFNEDDYNNIFNIVNPEDMVTMVPFDSITWGYDRLGITKVLPTKSYQPIAYHNLYNKMNVYFKDMTGTDYRNFKLGIAAHTAVYTIANSIIWGVRGFYGYRSISAHDFIISTVFNKEESQRPSENAVYDMFTVIPVIKTALENADQSNYIMTAFTHMHAMETYISWLRSGGDIAVASIGYRQLEINPEIDIEIRDENDVLMSEVKDGKINQELAEEFFPTFKFATEANTDEADLLKIQEKEGSEKVMIHIPLDFNGKAIINGNTTDMDLVIKEFTTKMKEDSAVYFNDIDLGLEGEHQIAFKANESLQNLHLVHIEHTHDVDNYVEGDDVDSVKIEVQGIVDGNETTFEKLVNYFILNKGSGTVIGNVDVNVGDNITLSAIPFENNTFEGWYENDTLISKDKDLSFQVSGPRTLEVKYNKSTVFPSVVDILSNISK